jgi:hypothetical protein
MRRDLARTTVDRLVADLLDADDGHDLAAELRAWIASEPRFRDFAQLHRAKIRKKLRSATDVDALGDVRAELRAARLLLVDRRIELAFEAFGATKGGPDFVVWFRGHRSFTCEITRLRRPAVGVHDGGPLLAKLRQLPPSIANVVAIRIEGTSADDLDVEGAVAALRRRADAKDEAYFTRRGFAGTRDLYARFRRLGGVLVWCEAAAGDARARLWTNGSAHIGLPDRAVHACVNALRGGG